MDPCSHDTRPAILGPNITISRRDRLKNPKKAKKPLTGKVTGKNFPATIPAVGRSAGRSVIPRVLAHVIPSSATHPEPSRGVPSVCPAIHQHPPPYIALMTFSDLAPGDIEVSEESLVPKKNKYLEFGCDFLQAY